MKDRKANVDMLYNTQQEFLIMPEYGRNVQQLVRHAQNIQDSEYRQAFCEEIVDLIQQLYPQSKNVEDYREKLWAHLFHIAKYDLDARTPSGEIPKPENARVKPQRIPYPLQDTRFRHYGNNVQVMIRRAIEMEPGYIKTGFVNTIGSYMKMAYRTWNREHFVSDDLIKNDLTILSDGKLTLEDDSRIDGLANASRSRGGLMSGKERERERDRRSNQPTNLRRDGRDNRDNRGDVRNDRRTDGRTDGRTDNRSDNRSDNRNDSRNDSRGGINTNNKNNVNRNNNNNNNNKRK